MTRMCIVCGVTFKLDRSAYRHVVLSHYVPNNLARIYVVNVDIRTPAVDDGDDVELEIVS
jgi:hypothetical protein